MHLFYLSRVARMTATAWNVQKARRRDSYFIMMNPCLNIHPFSPPALKIKIFLDI